MHSETVALLADRMLGKLARLLRMAGQDVTYVREADPGKIARQAHQEGRILLTRDRRLAQNAPGRVLLVSGNYPFHQARWVIRELDLTITDRFDRCVEDNGRLHPVRRESIEADLPPKVLALETRFLRCEYCQKIYWEGTHVTAMRRMIADLKEAPLVPSDEGEDEDDGGLGKLAPLVDLHQAMDVLLLRHRLALMDRDLPLAQRMLSRFSLCLRRHLEDETELVLPLYLDAEPSGGFERGAAPDIFEGEHQKILVHLSRIESEVSAVERAERAQGQIDASCLRLLDRQKTFVDLLAHHDRRERVYLYPALERTLTELEKVDLLERMVDLKG